MGRSTVVNIAPPASAAQVLRLAAQALTRFGWHQGQAVGGDGRLCVYAALRYAVCGDPRPDILRLTRRQRRALIVAICLLANYLEMPGLNIAAWNEESGRTADEVVGTLRDAADWATGPRVAEQAARFLASLPAGAVR
jgi:hypothetical protein